jgi:chromosome segregation ATPase
LCNREFASAAEEAAFMQSNTSKMDKIVPADKAERAKAAVKAAKSKLEQLQALQPLWDQAHQLRTKDLPALEAQLAQLGSEISAAQGRRAALDLEAKKLREREDATVELLKVVGGALRLGADVCAAFEGLQRSQAKLAAEVEAAGGDASGGSGRSLETVTAEYDALERTNVALQKACSSLQDDVERLRRQRQELVERVTKLKEQRGEMARIEVEQSKLKKDEQENIAFYNSLKQEVAVLVRAEEQANRQRCVCC